MKVLLNGSTVSEIMQSRMSKEERMLEACAKMTDKNKQIIMFDKILGHFKRNKKVYLRIVFVLAITLDRATLIACADSATFISKLNELWDRISGLLFAVGKFSCMGIGIKEMVVCLIDGGNMKEASYAGMKYWLGFIFLQIYPGLYDLVEGLRI